MVRSDEFFNLIVELEGAFSDRMAASGFPRKYGIEQYTLNAFNRRHNLPMERIEALDLTKAKDIFLEFFYLPVKSISNPEMHFNFIDIFYFQWHKSYECFKEIQGSLGKYHTVDLLYELRELICMDGKEELAERLSKIKSYFKNR